MYFLTGSLELYIDGGDSAGALVQCDNSNSIIRLSDLQGSFSIRTEARYPELAVIVTDGQGFVGASPQVNSCLGGRSPILESH